MAVDNREGPLEVSVPIRYCQDGQSWQEGVVRTVGGGGFAIQTDAIPATGAKLFFALGMGGESAFHGEGRVTTLAAPAAGVEPIRGFGLRFDGTPNELTALAAKLANGYPGPVELDGDGRLAWPVAVDGAGLAADSAGPSLMLHSDGRLVGRAAATSLASTSAPLPTYVAIIRELSSEVASLGDAHAQLHYRGRPLAPATDLPAHVLAKGLAALDAILPPPRANAGADPVASEPWTLDVSDLDAPIADVPITSLDDDAPSEAEILWDHPILELVATQMRIMDTLAIADWRFQRLGPEAREALDRDRTLLDGIQLRLATSADEADLGEAAVEEVAQVVEAIGTLVVRAAWHATAIEPVEASTSAIETFHIEKERIARQAVMAARAAAREAEEEAARKTDAAKADANKKKASPDKAKKSSRKGGKVGGVSVFSSEIPDQVEVPKWAIAAAAGGVLLAIFSLQQTLSSKGVKIPKTIDVPAVRAAAQQASPKFPLQDVVLDKGTAKVFVATEWLGRTAGERAGDFEKVATVLIGKGFWDVVVQTPDGKEQASMHKGVFNVVGLEHKER